MPYLGNTPADKYSSYSVQHFTTSATTSYTLDFPVANENEIELFINNVRQEPGSSYAYTASGTALTLSAATSASDTMYCVFQGKATQTVTPTLPIANFSSTGIDDNATSTAVTIDSSGNVGIGTVPSGARLEVSNGDSGVTPFGDVFFEDDAGFALALATPNTENAVINFADPESNNVGQLKYDHASNYMAFTTNGSEAMRITSGGKLVVGDTTGTANSPMLDAIGGATQVAFTGYRKTSTVASTVVNFRSDVGSTAALIAEIEANGDVVTTSGSYTAYSDINLKQDIVDAQSQWEDIKALQVKNFKLKSLVNAYGEDAPTYLGVIAQEVEASGMNGLVSENEEGTKYVKYSILYMKAIKALQEAMQKIEDLEARVNTLEGN